MECLHLFSLFALNFPKGTLKKQYLCQDLIICLHILSNLPFIFILDCWICFHFREFLIGLVIPLNFHFLLCVCVCVCVCFFSIVPLQLVWITFTSRIFIFQKYIFWLSILLISSTIFFLPFLTFRGIWLRTSFYRLQINFT